MSDLDDVIDFAGYVKRREEGSSGQRTTFTLWGGDGERVRFALPLWRAAYLGGGHRAALVSQPTDAPEGTSPEPLVVLDLLEETARLEFDPDCLAGVKEGSTPGTLKSGELGVTVYLGEADGCRWYMVVDDLASTKPDVDGRARGDLLFLAGECSGLLFFRGLASDNEGGTGA